MPSDSFAPVHAVAAVMAPFPGPWCVAGGWAIDLFLDRVTREHADLEVAVVRRDQGALRAHLAGWELCKAVATPAGGEWVPWPPGEWLALPVHQVRAQREGGVLREFEVFLVEADGDRWQCRRDPQLTRPLDETAFRSRRGIPTLVPEIQLLYKAKHHRPKDEVDFQAALPHLNRAQRAWLSGALQRCHPGDAWIRQL